MLVHQYRERARGKQNKNLTGPVVIGSDFQKTFAHLPFGATTISTERGINLSFAQRSRLKTPINERLNFILLALWRSLYGHDSEMDATIRAAAHRPPSRGNEHCSDRIAFGSRYPSVRAFRLVITIGWWRAIGRLMLPLSGSLMLASYRTRAYRGSLVALQLLFFAK